MIMNNNILKYALGAAAAAFLASCDLDLMPSESIGYEKGTAMIISEADVTSFENGVLASLRSLSSPAFVLPIEVGSECFNATVHFGESWGTAHRMDDSFTAEDSYVENYWKGAYKTIKNFNFAIEQADLVSDDLWPAAHTLKGEAYLGRACAYLMLARTFGAKAYDPSTASTDLCVPLVLVYDQNAKPVRATMKEVYASIKSDLDSAAVILAGVPGEVRAQKPTIDAVNAIYARYCLDVQDYANAAAYAMKVINSSAGYSLASTVEDLEAAYYSENDDQNTEAVMQMYASASEGGFKRSAFTGLAYTFDGGESLQPSYLPSSMLMDAYEEGDHRLAAWFYDGSEAAASMRGSYIAFMMNGQYFQGEFYALAKFSGNRGYTGQESGISETTSAKPVLVSEMYLIAAEAYAQSGDSGQATSVLNALQTARGASATSGTMDNIKTEWLRETVGEGLRLSCVRRWGDGYPTRMGQPGAQSAGVLMEGSAYEGRAIAADDYRMAWPIPAHDIQDNGNLKQNAGWE